MNKLRYILAVCLLVLLTACSAPTSETREIFAMDTLMTLTAYGDNAESALDEAVSMLHRYESLWSATDPESVVAQINAANGQPVEAPAEVCEPLALSKQLSAQTDGALNCATYPLTCAWGFPDDNYRVPGETELSVLLPLCDWRQIEIGDSTVTLQPGMAIDLGAVAKGYAGQQIADRLRDLGIESAILSLGGNVQTVGTKPDGSRWKVAIRDPRTEGGMLGVLETADQAVVTSGGYQRYFEQDGVRYHHILDPQTGHPASSGLSSVTVVCTDGARADGLSTALFVMGVGKAVEFQQQQGDFGCVLLTDEGRLLVSDNLRAYFSNATELDVQYF